MMQGARNVKEMDALRIAQPVPYGRTKITAAFNVSAQIKTFQRNSTTTEICGRGQPKLWCGGDPDTSFVIAYDS